jgi:hypothetical protein
LFTARYGLGLQIGQVQFRPLRDIREVCPFKNGKYKNGLFALKSNIFQITGSKSLQRDIFRLKHFILEQMHKYIIRRYN